MKKYRIHLIGALSVLFLFFSLYWFPQYMNIITSKCGPNVKILDLSPGYNKEDVLHLFDCAGEDGRRAIKFISGFIDMLYPFVYGALLILLIYVFSEKNNNKTALVRFLVIVTAGGVVVDFFENKQILFLLKEYPTIKDADITMASFLTITKWFLLLFSNLFILYSLFRWLYFRFKN